MKTTNIDFVLAASVAAGTAPPNTIVGVGQDLAGRWYNGFVAFDRETGAPVISVNGAQRFNWRAQTPRQ